MGLPGGLADGAVGSVCGQELWPPQALVGSDVVHWVGPVVLVGLVGQPPHLPWAQWQPPHPWEGVGLAVVWEPPQDQAWLLPWWEDLWNELVHKRDLSGLVFGSE